MFFACLLILACVMVVFAVPSAWAAHMAFDPPSIPIQNACTNSNFFYDVDSENTAGHTNHYVLRNLSSYSEEDQNKLKTDRKVTVSHFFDNIGGANQASHGIRINDTNGHITWDPSDVSTGKYAFVVIIQDDHDGFRDHHHRGLFEVWVRDPPEMTNLNANGTTSFTVLQGNTVKFSSKIPSTANLTDTEGHANGQWTEEVVESESKFMGFSFDTTGVTPKIYDFSVTVDNDVCAKPYTFSVDVRPPVAMDSRWKFTSKPICPNISVTPI